MGNSKLNEYIDLEVTFRRVAESAIEDSLYSVQIILPRSMRCLTARFRATGECINDMLRNQTEKKQRNFLARWISTAMESIKNDLIEGISSEDLRIGILKMIGTPEELKNVEMET